MHEAQRQHYLAAMGVTQYVARLPLPGARPSPVRQFVAKPALPADNTASPAVDTHRHTPVIALLDTTATPPRRTETLPPTDLPDAPKTEKSQTDSTPFACQIAIWIVQDLLVLAEVSRLDNAQLSLLRNILLAIGRGDTLPDARQFSWPLPPRKEKSLSAARDHFQGMLDGGLLREPGVRQILCMGDAPATLLNTDASTAQSYGDWPVIRTCSLQHMLSEPASKRDTWRVLQLLVRT